jgi:hypothetical protein
MSSVSSGNALFSVCNSYIAGGYRYVVKGLIACVYVVVVSDILVTGQGRMYLVLSAFASRPIWFVATNNSSVFVYNTHIFS